MARGLLVVEDDLALMEFIVGAARDRGYDASGIADPTRVTTWVREQRPEVVILDLRMPMVDGRDLLASIAKDPGPTVTAVVVISGMDDPYTVELCFRYGAADFVRKPFVLGELFLRVELAIRARPRRS